MLWHIVKFHFRPDVTDGDRRAAEDGIAAMPDEIEVIRFLRLARSIDEPDVTGVLVGFDDADAMAAYAADPVHVPAAQRIDALCAQVIRMDLVTPDDPATFLPRTA